MTSAVFRALLRLFPAEFRRLHRDEMLDQLERDRSATRGTERLRFWGRSLTDLPRAALRLRAARRRSVDNPDRMHPRATHGGIELIPMNLLKDLRHGARSLLAAPLSSAVIVLTLAVAIGLNTAVYSVVDRLLLHPIDHPRAEQLVHVATRYPEVGLELQVHPGGVFQRIRDSVDAFDAVGAIMTVQQNLSGIEAPEQIEVGWASPELFEVVSVVPQVGRLFARDDTPDFVILSHGLWTRAFGGDPAAIGRVVSLDSVPYTVIGVLPADATPQLWPSTPRIDAYRLPDDRWANGDVWNWLGPDVNQLRVVGRLAPGATLQEAQQQLDAVAAHLLDDTDLYDETGLELPAMPLRHLVVRNVRATVTALAGSVGLLLLIACANVMNLMLVRTRARRHEVSLRLAIGARPGRIVRLLLAESGLLALAGGLLGVALGSVSLAVIRAIGAADLPRLTSVSLDGRVMLFAAGVTLACPLLFGLVPAVGAARGEVVRDLGSARTTDTRRGRWLAHSLVVAQLGLSLVLLIGTGLMLASIGRLKAVDPGFRTDDVLTFSVTLPGSRYQWPEGANGFYRELEERIERLPQAQSAAIVWPLPLSGSRWAGEYSGGAVSAEDRTNVRYVLATSGFFDTAGIAIADGRTFADDDPIETVVVTGSLADRTWPGQRAVGETLYADPWGRGPTPFTVIGVVDDVRMTDLRTEPEAMLYFDARGWSWVDWEVDVMVRATADAPGLIGPIRDILADIDAEVPMAEVRTMSDLIDELLASSRFAMTLLAAFAGVAGLLAILGLYAVVSYTVSQRTRELGIRMALGSDGLSLVRLVVGQGLRVAIVGLALGQLGAWALTGYLGSFLYGVSATDPATFAGVSALLLVVAALACSLPARRASRLDPARVLRAQ